jgi:tRNA splicing ligase
MQYQGLYLLFEFQFIKQSNASKQNIAPVLSTLFNRHPQTTRERLSSINRLFYSPNKAEQKAITQDLETWKQLFEKAGFSSAAKRADEELADPKKFTQIL